MDITQRYGKARKMATIRREYNGYNIGDGNPHNIKEVISNKADQAFCESPQKLIDLYSNLITNIENTPDRAIQLIEEFKCRKSSLINIVFRDSLNFTYYPPLEITNSSERLRIESCGNPGIG